MSFSERDSDDWSRRFTSNRGSARGGGSFGSINRNNIFSEFEDMRREMERMVEEMMQDVDRMPKNLIREYETQGGTRVREVGPVVYGYSVTVGPDGKPVIREFGNVKAMPGTRMGMPQLTSEREPLADIVTTDKEVKITVEMPGINKEDINVKSYNHSVEISTAENARRKYHTIVEVPPEADLNTVKSNYKNGILEITFTKKTNPKGKEIRVE
jgi:HSP20 family protein